MREQPSAPLEEHSGSSGVAVLLTRYITLGTVPSRIQLDLELLK